MESLISQTIGFQDHVQVILVNNGSVDDSGEVCARYREQYPDNITYLNFETSMGAGGARNAGIPFVEGKYVNFMDSDDTWDLDAMEKADNFFQQHEGEIDCVFARIRTFEGLDRFLYEDEQREKERIVDIEEEPRFLQHSAGSAFIRAERVKEHPFCETLGSYEDTRYVAEVLLDRCKYGIIYSVLYHFRKRMDNTNLSQHFETNESYYTVDLAEGPEYLLSLAEGKRGRGAAYLQHAAMYLISRRLSQKKLQALDLEYKAEYLDRIGGLLQKVDDSVILQDKSVFLAYRFYALKLKYGDALKEHLHCDNGTIYFGETPSIRIKKSRFCKIEIMDIRNGELILEGRFGIPIPQEDYEVIFRDSEGRIYPCANYEPFDTPFLSLDDRVGNKPGFRIHIPADKDLDIHACIRYGGEEYVTGIKYGKWAKLSDVLDWTYYWKKGVVVRKSKKGIRVRTGESPFKRELRLLREIRKKAGMKVCLQRLCAQAVRKFKIKKIWLFADRINVADENAEFLFNYITQQPHPGIRLYYALSGASPDVQRMSASVRGGKVVRYDSAWYRFLFLICDVLVTSQTTGFILQPTGIRHDYYTDLVPPYVYLQHGVMEKDLSSSQNKIAQNLRIFVTSAFSEYRSLLEYPYGYGEREAKLTGLARHDLILPHMDHRGKRVIIAPTWRHNLSTRVDQKKGGRSYNPYFKASEFYQFYNGLMNDPVLLSAMREKGYTGVFKPHPFLIVQSVDFEENDVFKVDLGSLSYEQQFEDCGLLITDYSSIAMEYAYAKCPVIYTQFDRETFYGNHTYEKGFFDYETDGFGPVCYDYETTRAAIIKAIEENCIMTDEYLERREKFFAFFDGKNRERIYQEILKIDQED